MGRKVYNNHCFFCHGYDGKADTVASSFLSPHPVNFTQPPPGLDRDTMIEAVTHGKKGTAMVAFQGVLSAREIASVVDFIRATFMRGKGTNTRYHTRENGWYHFDRYRAAFPFALGEIPLGTPWDRLTPQQRRGKRLFLGSCITCHGRGRPGERGPLWEPQPEAPASGQYEYPGYAKQGGADPYARHEVAPVIAGLNPAQRRGEALFQRNCAMCHAADGTGRNWMGSVLKPHPRDLTDARFMARLDRDKLRRIIEEGVPDSAMPAWRSVLNREQVADLIAYISRAFYPVGDGGAGASRRQ